MRIAYLTAIISYYVLIRIKRVKLDPRLENALCNQAHDKKLKAELRRPQVDKFHHKKY